MKKTLRETQTLRAGCSKKDPNIFAPPQTPFPGGAERPKFNQLAGDGHYLYIHRLQTQFGEDRCTQFRVIVVTDPQTRKQTHRRTDYNTLRRSHSSDRLPLPLEFRNHMWYNRNRSGEVTLRPRENFHDNLYPFRYNTGVWQTRCHSNSRAMLRVARKKCFYCSLLIRHRLQMTDSMQ